MSTHVRAYQDEGEGDFPAAVRPHPSVGTHHRMTRDAASNNLQTNPVKNHENDSFSKIVVKWKMSM